MLFYYLDYVCYGSLVFIIVIVACAWLAYSVNARRAVDDPKKRNFSPQAIILAPITLPFLMLGFISMFVLRVLLFGFTLILFTIALIGVRETLILPWFLKKLISFGNRLLEVNTLLIKWFWRPRAAQPETQKPSPPYNLDSLASRFV
jgi:hypothetical protein